MAEACYTEPYLPASFKFVPFKAMEVDSEHGRRGAEGEFPFSETTAYADMGRKIRRYTVSARFDSNNHVLEAAALIAAVETPGPGPLVHPTRGVITVACTSLRVRDSIEEEGGVTYVDLDFVEANILPNGLSLVGTLLGLVISAVIGSSRENFRASYQPNAVQPFRRTAVVQTAQQMTANVRQSYLSATVARASDANRNRIANDLQRLSNDFVMASDPDTVDLGISLGMQATANELNGSGKVAAFRSLANAAAKSSTFAAPAGVTEDAIYSLVRVSAAAFMAQGALEADDLRAGELINVLDQVDDILAQEAAYARATCSNDLFIELQNFRIDTSSKLYQKAYNSPGVVKYDFPSRVHPLNAAYSIYGDAKKHRDLEALNVVGSSGRFPASVAAVRSLV